MSSGEPEALLVMTLGEDADVFAARQVGRELATEVGLDRIDATRWATAISELAREAAGAGGARLSFAVRRGTDLVVTLTHTRLPRHAASIRAAERLVDSLTYAEADGGAVVELAKSAAAPLATADLDRLRTVVASQSPANPIEEMRQQNEELVALLDTVRSKNAELERLNRELEETNHGVMALYNELSGELERTNQGVVALYAEIDEKNEQLTAASEAKSRFLRSISHELRTPVNSVLGLTRLLTDPGAGPLTPEQTEQIDFIRASAADLLTLVNELLDLAKAESGRLDPVFQDLPVDVLCDELRSLASPLLREGVQLLIEDVPPGMVLRTDPDLLRHVTRNLLSNAAKFTTHGSVRVEIEQDEDETLLSIADTGLGISEEDQARVFEEFFQARTSLHATAKGTGLGLPFAQRVARALQGAIELRSTLGEGSRFTIRLPRRPEETSA
ncbi:ATP-binding protein [Nocardioides pyridinolyticus]